MAEFKKISDVDVLDELTENDNVLIVDANGALKQIASTNIKGGNGGAVGHVIKLTEDNYAYINYSHHYTDNYDDIYNVLVSGGIVWVDFELLEGRPYSEFVSSYGLSSEGLYLSCWDYNLMLPNGSHNLPEPDAN